MHQCTCTTGYYKPVLAESPCKRVQLNVFDPWYQFAVPLLGYSKKWSTNCMQQDLIDLPMHVGYNDAKWVTPWSYHTSQWQQLKESTAYSVPYQLCFHARTRLIQQLLPCTSWLVLHSQTTSSLSTFIYWRYRLGRKVLVTYHSVFCQVGRVIENKKTRYAYECEV